MNINCRFKLIISKGRWKDNFQCSADINGFAWSYDGTDISNPCPGCKKFTEGQPTMIDNWLNSEEFWKISGRIIRKKDWERFDSIKRNYS